MPHYLRTGSNNAAELRKQRDMDEERRSPPLIVITGSPGSGKTTLAGALQRELGYPLLRRDALKEILLDGLGANDRAESQRLGGVSWSLLYGMLDQLAGRAPVIVESNFSRGRDEVNLEPFLARARSVMLNCQTNWATIQRRIAARNGSIDRHPGHFDDIALPELEQRLVDGVYEPLDLPCPSLRIDTTDGLTPALPAILEFARTAGDWDFDPDGY